MLVTKKGWEKMAEFNVKLKALREEVIMTRQELGKKLGITDSAVAMYERGLRVPPLTTMRQIVKIFGVDFNYLLDPDIPVQSFKNRRALGERWQSFDLFVEAHPQYYGLIEQARQVKPEEIAFIKTLIEKMS